MKKARLLRVACMSFCFVLCIPVLFANFGESVVVPPGNASGEVDLLIQMVEDSENTDWKRPSTQRKAVVLRKLNVIKELVLDDNFSDAYDKMLHDIKPKLTGLKTDENEEAWSKGRTNSWVLSTDLKEEFRIQCNIILYLLTQPVIEDDDTSPPTITIMYYGDYHVGNPGEWVIEIEDLESGLDEVIITVDGVVIVHNIGLGGIDDLTYYISVPAIIAVHTIVVTATNNDTDWAGDQESNTVSAWVDIGPIPDPTPPIIIG